MRPVVGHHHRDPGRRGPLECVNHHQKLHQVLVHRIAGGLHHKHIHSAHVFEELEVHFAIGKALNFDFAHRNSDVAADLLGQRLISRPAEELEALVLAQVAGPFALDCRFRILGSALLGILRRGILAGAVPLTFRLFVFRCRSQCSRIHFRLPPSWLALAVLRALNSILSFQSRSFVRAQN